MKKIKYILLLIFLISFNLVKSQEFYNINETLYNIDKLKIYLNKMEEFVKKTNSIKLKPYFRTNRIEVRGDSIINFGNVTFVPKNFKQEKIFNLINKPLPNFTLEKYTGKNLDNQELNGKLTIINLWFTNCPPCINEIPFLNSIKEKYNDKINYIAITYEDRAKVYDFFKIHTFDFNILINARKYIEVLGSDSYPKILLVDKNNIVRYVDFGIPVTNNNDLIKQQEVFYKAINKLI
jgi:thiol-disulfide isomerase/thioredoxin